MPANHSLIAGMARSYENQRPAPGWFPACAGMALRDAKFAGMARFTAAAKSLLIPQAGEGGRKAGRWFARRMRQCQ